MADYMRPSAAEVDALVDLMIEHIGNQWDIDIVTLKSVLVDDIEGLLDGMYEIPAASATIRDGMNAATSLTEDECTIATTWLYEHVFMKEGWQG